MLRYLMLMYQAICFVTLKFTWGCCAIHLISNRFLHPHWSIRILQSTTTKKYVRSFVSPVCPCCPPISRHFWGFRSLRVWRRWRNNQAQRVEQRNRNSLDRLSRRHAVGFGNCRWSWMRASLFLVNLGQMDGNWIRNQYSANKFRHMYVHWYQDM